MPDFCMCRNINCKSRKNCLRYLSVPSQYRQTYANFCSKEPVPTKCKCEFYVYKSKNKELYYPTRTVEEADSVNKVLFE